MQISLSTSASFLISNNYIGKIFQVYWQLDSVPISYEIKEYNSQAIYIPRVIGGRKFFFFLWYYL